MVQIALTGLTQEVGDRVFRHVRNGGGQPGGYQLAGGNRVRRRHERLPSGTHPPIAEARAATRVPGECLRGTRVRHQTPDDASAIETE